MIKSNFDIYELRERLKRTDVPIAYLNDQKSILQIKKEKAPDEDRTP